MKGGGVATRFKQIEKIIIDKVCIVHIERQQRTHWKRQHHCKQNQNQQI